MELSDGGLVAVAAALRTGAVSAVEYATALLARCESAAEHHGFITLDADGLLRSAAEADRRRAAGAPMGPLHGVPLAIKDVIAVRGLPRTAGNAALREDFSPRDAAVVGRLRGAGGLVLGTTNLHELSMGWTSVNHVFGDVVHPTHPGHDPGGSSGGSAVAVALGLAPSALGTDTNGSIRIPAAFCGVVGLRPSTGRHSTAGILPLAPSLDTVGFLGRTVADVALLDAVLIGSPPAPAADLRGVRLGLAPAFFWSGLDPELGRVVRTACERLRAAGAVLVEADVDGLEEAVRGTAPALIAHEARSALAAAGLDIDALVAAASPDIAAHLRRGTTDPSEHVAALERAGRVRELLRAHLRTAGLAALVHPVTRMPPPLASADHVSPAPAVRIDGHTVPAAVAYGQNVAAAALSGLPALVLPAGRTAAGLPAGIELLGRGDEDTTLLSLGLAVETALGR